MQDGILPEDNTTDSLNSAWVDSRSTASTLGSSISDHSEHSTVLFVPPFRHSSISVDVAVSASTMQVSISLEGTDLANVLVNGAVLRIIFTAHLSRALLNIITSFGP